MRGPGGFALAEVIVALVLLTVGLLASVSMVSLAARTMGEARRVSAAAAAAEALADSLLRNGSGGTSGSRSHAWGSLRWEAGAGREVRIVATADPDAGEAGAGGNGASGERLLVELHLRLPGEPPAP